MVFIPAPALLDLLSHLFHTTFITDGRQLKMDQKYVDELVVHPDSNDTLQL